MKAIRANTCGLTLVELMVALAIASLTMLGAVRLYSHATTMVRSAYAVQALEESAHLALTVLRRDIELAGFFGFLNDEPTLPIEPGFTVRNDCAPGWATRIEVPVDGSDNRYPWACRAYAGAAMTAADTLVVRYAGPERTTDPQPGTVYLHSNAGGFASLELADTGTVPPADPLSAFQQLQARGYYVSRTSAGDADEFPIPSLRLKYLTTRGGRATIVDEEVQRGVEDMQAEFATQPGRFVPASELGANERVTAVRIWVLLRSPARESGLGSYAVAAYANRPRRIYNDGFRRSLAHTTVTIADARPL